MSTVHVPAKIKAEVEAKLRACIKIAEQHYGEKFSFPTVNYTQRGRTAGTASLQTWTVNFNSILLMENTADFIARTVPHEMAHLIDYQLHPENFERSITYDRRSGMRRQKRDVHGVTWKTIMMLFGADTSRCHTYDVSNAKISKRKQRKHVYICKTCGGEMKLGAKRHANMSSGRAKYWMRGCGRHAGFEYIGMEGQSAPVALPKAANTAKPKRSTKSGGKKQTKLTACRAVYDDTASRKHNISLFVAVGCTPAGAATYYAKIKKEMS